MPRIGAVGAIAATLALLLVGGMVLHNRPASHAAVPAIPRVATGAETRQFGATNRPNAVAAESGPIVVTSSQRRFLEANTTTLPGAVAPSMTSPTTPRARQRFWEVNTMLAEGAASPYAEDPTPLPGHPR